MRNYKRPFKCGHPRTDENSIIKPKTSDGKWLFRTCKTCRDAFVDKRKLYSGCRDPEHMRKVCLASIAARMERPFKCGHVKSLENSKIRSIKHNRITCLICWKAKLTNRRQRANPDAPFTCGHPAEGRNRMITKTKWKRKNGTIGYGTTRRCRKCYNASQVKIGRRRANSDHGRVIKRGPTCPKCYLSEPHSCLYGSADNRATIDFMQRFSYGGR